MPIGMSRWGCLASCADTDTASKEHAGAWRARLRDLTGSGADLDLGTSNGQAGVWDHDAVLLVDEAGRLRECRVAAAAPLGVTRAAAVTALAGAGADRALLVRIAGIGARPRLDVVLSGRRSCPRRCRCTRRRSDPYDRFNRAPTIGYRTGKTHARPRRRARGREP